MTYIYDFCILYFLTVTCRVFVTVVTMCCYCIILLLYFFFTKKCKFGPLGFVIVLLPISIYLSIYLAISFKLTEPVPLL